MRYLIWILTLLNLIPFSLAQSCIETPVISAKDLKLEADIIFIGEIHYHYEWKKNSYDFMKEIAIKNKVDCLFLELPSSKENQDLLAQMLEDKAYCPADNFEERLGFSPSEEALLITSPFFEVARDISKHGGKIYFYDTSGNMEMRNKSMSESILAEHQMKNCSKSLAWNGLGHLFDTERGGKQVSSIPSLIKKGSSLSTSKIIIRPKSEIKKDYPRVRCLKRLAENDNFGFNPSQGPNGKKLWKSLQDLFKKESMGAPTMTKNKFSEQDLLFYF